MTHALSDPVNLMTELDDYTSASCARRVLARALGHAGLNLAEAREMWFEIEPASDQWGKYSKVIQAMT